MESECDLAGLADEAIALIASQVTEKQQSLAVELSCGNVALRVDRQRMIQILVNVLGNANKFIPNNGHIWLRADRTADSGLLIEVEDDGPGMTEQEIETAWAPFGRVSDSLTTSEGTGLGLPLSRSLAEMHGGSLEIESRKGKGTVLRLSLPATRVFAR